MQLTNLASRCDELANPSLANFGVSIFILVGILVSYLPQHYRIIARRSSEGLSPYFVLLGTTSGTCAIANILILPTSRTDVGCCREISPFACGAALLGIAQVGVQWSCFFLIMLLFLVFFPRPSAADSENDPKGPTYRSALIVVGVSILHFLVVFLVSITLLARFPEMLQLWANVLGISASVLASIQYLPQIYTTWKLQAVKSLSIPMMCIQTPGSFVFAASLAVRLGREGWSAWTVYLVTGCLQGVLLVMGISFEVREWRKRKADAEGRDEVRGERAPLLGDGEGARQRSHDSANGAGG
ncbi:hypothetical protein W97_00134 [Coniosporium apollinis CBS 100218]|uniref:PQ loop repeat protein n=1 Tax=Coniosporium apollinis (strain CBS 100218) TaxID=1168221 RepID=R7YGI7_CONA1|nr:uncharacterized protein W97_00134 [Coniosporium apollinis CBS 100218]EON60924.1 hypothetical protein W97_00134 [Coniosporium apollinis CBS 100218]